MMKNSLVAKRAETFSNSVERCDQRDDRFQRLLSPESWLRLAPAVRKRFSKKVSNKETIIYVGRITCLRKNRAGRFLAQLLRLIGAPLPIADDVDVPSVVSVTEDVANEGQVWTRLYANKTCFPQVIHSSKRFGGRTGLEEYIGFGVTMALLVREDNRALVFKSAGYAFGLLGMRFPIPGFLNPGSLIVRHEDQDGETFEFSMTLHHPLFGELVHQCGCYREDKR